MGVELYLTGRCGRSRNALEPIAATVRERCAETLVDAQDGSDRDGHPAWFAQLHPAAAAVEFIDQGDGRLAVSAKTSTAGAGYHQYVCDLLRELGTAHAIAWDPPAPDRDTGDETGYFHGGDRDGIEREMFVW